MRHYKGIKFEKDIFMILNSYYQNLYQHFHFYILREEGGYFDQRITFRWGLLHPTTKYKRDILFGFGDLIGKCSFI